MRTPNYYYLLPLRVLSRLNAAEISARWENACGVLPSCSPDREISSEKMRKWLPKLSMFSNILTASLKYFSSYAPACHVLA